MSLITTVPKKSGLQGNVRDLGQIFTAVFDFLLMGLEKYGAKFSCSGSTCTIQIYQFFFFYILDISSLYPINNIRTLFIRRQAIQVAYMLDIEKQAASRPLENNNKWVLIPKIKVKVPSYNISLGFLRLKHRLRFFKKLLQKTGHFFVVFVKKKSIFLFLKSLKYDTLLRA